MLFLPLRFLGRKIVQGEKDVLMEKRLCLEISRAKEMREKWEYNYFLWKLGMKMMHNDYSDQVNYFQIIKKWNTKNIMSFFAVQIVLNGIERK